MKCDEAGGPVNKRNTEIAKTDSGFLERILEAALDGIGPFKPAADSAADALAGGRSTDEAVKRLIRTHAATAGGTGFVTNVGGLITLPVSLPANVGASLLIQIHLIAAIAAVHGHDIDTEDVKAAILLSLLGNAGTEVLKKVGIEVGTKLSMAALKRLPISVLRDINRRVGFMLLAKYGTKRASITLAKFIPLIGGIIGGGVDAGSTVAVGRFAHRFFGGYGAAEVPESLATID